MNLLLNDQSGKLKVVDFPRGSQARKICTEKAIDPDVFKGATIVAVNGTRYELQEDLFDALKNPGRPKSIMFEVANPEDAARVNKFVQSSLPNRAKEKEKKKRAAKTAERVFFTTDMVVKESTEIGLEFAKATDGYGLIVKGFVSGEGGTVLAAERSGNVKLDDLLTHVNGKSVVGAAGEGQKKALEVLEAEGDARPLTLSFSDENHFSSNIFHSFNAKSQHHS